MSRHQVFTKWVLWEKPTISRLYVYRKCEKKQKMQSLEFRSNSYSLLLKWYHQIQNPVIQFWDWNYKNNHVWWVLWSWTCLIARRHGRRQTLNWCHWTQCVRGSPSDGSQKPPILSILIHVYCPFRPLLEVTMSNQKHIWLKVTG